MRTPFRILVPLALAVGGLGLLLSMLAALTIRAAS